MDEEWMGMSERLRALFFYMDAEYRPWRHPSRDSGLVFYRIDSIIKLTN